ncbi:hypothetical protein B0H21DRAFT_848596 [Amylocystis lapponica]|nr:hypothetical protein B0H21DRAFT_848596 [Amylocystis lapponica]
MEDPELAAIRAARMNQLQQTPRGGAGEGAGREDDGKQAAAEEEMRRTLLATVLDSAARERLARISLVSPDRSRQIEAILLRMAQSGQLRGRVSENQLIELLEQAEEAQPKGPKKGAIVVSVLSFPGIRRYAPMRSFSPSSSGGRAVLMTMMISTYSVVHRVPTSRHTLLPPTPPSCPLHSTTHTTRVPPMSTRVHTHSPLPAPALHATSVSAQSKSHVLAGVQDAYWSDDEAEDAECPLCLEEMDISDLNFKPCPCGYQICRFCWHHIKENLNGRCPACRREYTDDAVQFKPINKEDHKRLTQQKKQRERERKELDALNRRHLANVRVVQRNVAYVIGIGPRFAKEELIPTLRSNEYFGQYGKISKIVIVKRTPPGGRAPVVGLYITYHRREDAARAIAAVDGAPSPGGGQEVMRASYGTTKYCMTFLRGVSCPDHGCMNLHEWGDEKDCFTKEDLTTLKHTMKDTETRARTTTVTRKSDETDAALPRGASWASKVPTSLTATALHNNTNANNQLPPGRQTRRGATTATTRQQRPGSAGGPSTPEPRGRERKAGTGKAPSQASTSRPATPAGPTSNRPVTPAKTAKQKETAPPPVPAASRPASSGTVESDGSAGQDGASTKSPVVRDVAPNVPSVPPGLPAAPPGLSAPPGLPPPVRPAADTSIPPQLSLQSSQSSYQMSTQALALMEDLKARREVPQSVAQTSPFPDFDRMLQTLSGADGNGGFSFNLDPALAGDEQESALVLSDLDAEAAIPFQGTFLDAFPALRQGVPPANPLMAPPGLSYPHQHRSIYDPLSTRSPAVERQSTGGSSYTGSFNPFAAETTEDAPTRRYSPLDEERKVSRFGFARGRQGSTSSSLHPTSPLGNGDNVAHMPYYSSSEMPSPAPRASPQWSLQNRQHHDYTQHQSSSAMSSPLAQQAQAQSPYSLQQQPGRFQPFDSGLSEAQLRDFINSSRANMRNGSSDHAGYKYHASQPFTDPAIMSARLASPILAQASHEAAFANSMSLAESYSSSHLGYGPPPGLSFADGHQGSPAIPHGYHSSGGPSPNLEVSQNGSAQVSTSPSPSLAPSPALSSSDFPALPAAEPARREQQSEQVPEAVPAPGSEAEAKAARKVAKKAAAAERAAERQRLAQEKAAVKAAEKERIALEKAAEKEKAAVLKAEKEKVAEEERVANEKVEREKAREKAERAEKDRLERERAEQEQIDNERLQKQKEQATLAKDAITGKPVMPAGSGPPSTASSPQIDKTPGRRVLATKQVTPPVVVLDSIAQVPIMQKMPKKNKPSTKSIKIPREEASADVGSALPSAATSDAPQFPDVRTQGSSSSNSRSHSIDMTFPSQPASVTSLLAELDVQFPWMNITNHPFFDVQKINPAAKMPLEYGPLVHALSALSVGGGSFTNNMPSGSIDNAVSSFQQLLETLTQTISDLLRLLPRKTWDDNSSFDGVLRDMLKGDDFLDDGGDDHNGQGKEDEVAALTLALERRARWMEVQLSKLEELHRDINTAAVRAVLSFNDNGWDVHGFMPRVGNTLQRFDHIGMVTVDGAMRPMTADELEKKLTVAKEAAVFAEAELREMMLHLQEFQPPAEDDF